jgi:predicted phage terminase large subunit-like protein
VLLKEYDPQDPEALPKRLRVYGASDYATMEVKKGKREPDFTEHGVFGMDPAGDLWAIDWWYRQCETDVGIDAFIRLLKQHKPVKWWNEGGLIDKAISPTIRRAMREARSFVAIEYMPNIQDKGAKLQAFHARTTAGTVHFPIKRPWAEHVIETLVKFPAGRWDDAADVCGLIGRGIDQMIDPQLLAENSRPMLVPYTEKWLEYNERDNQPKVRYF